MRVTTVLIQEFDDKGCLLDQNVVVYEDSLKALESIKLSTADAGLVLLSETSHRREYVRSNGHKHVFNIQVTDLRPCTSCYGLL